MQGDRFELGYGKIRWSTDDAYPYGKISLHTIKGEAVRLRGVSLRGKRGELIARMLNAKELTIGTGTFRSSDQSNIAMDWFDVAILQKMHNRTVVLFFKEE